MKIMMLSFLVAGAVMAEQQDQPTKREKEIAQWSMDLQGLKCDAKGSRVYRDIDSMEIDNGKIYLKDRNGRNDMVFDLMYVNERRKFGKAALTGAGTARAPHGYIYLKATHEGKRVYFKKAKAYFSDEYRADKEGVWSDPTGRSVGDSIRFVNCDISEQERQVRYERNFKEWSENLQGVMCRTRPDEDNYRNIHDVVINNGIMDLVTRGGRVVGSYKILHVDGRYTYGKAIKGPYEYVEFYTGWFTTTLKFSDEYKAEYENIRVNLLGKKQADVDMDCTLPLEEYKKRFHKFACEIDTEDNPYGYRYLQILNGTISFLDKDKAAVALYPIFANGGGVLRLRKMYGKVLIDDFTDPDDVQKDHNYVFFDLYRGSITFAKDFEYSDVQDGDFRGDVGDIENEVGEELKCDVRDAIEKQEKKENEEQQP